MQLAACGSALQTLVFVVTRVNHIGCGVLINLMMGGSIMVVAVYVPAWSCSGKVGAYMCT